MNITEKFADGLYENPRSIGSRLRARRIAPLVEMIKRVRVRQKGVKVLDIGGKPGYWRIVDRGLLRESGVTITILNLPDGRPLDADDEIFKHVEGNGCDLREYADMSFDIVHSNSVLEHVGDWRNMKSFAREVRRVASRLFVQTPYFWFPLEPHYMCPFFHWIPRPLQVSLIRKFTLGNRGKADGLDDALEKIEEAPRLVDQRTMRLLFPDCQIFKERFLLFTKSLIAVRNPVPQEPAA